MWKQNKHVDHTYFTTLSIVHFIKKSKTEYNPTNMVQNSRPVSNKKQLQSVHVP